MTNDNQRIVELERQIADLPTGSVVQKHVAGKAYYYHRTSHEGKRSERSIPVEEAAALREQIALRKSLIAELRELRAGVSVPGAPRSFPVGSALDSQLCTNVFMGNNLLRFAEGAAGWEERACIVSLNEYLATPRSDRVFVLYGLRRTGKTTLIRQAVLAMDSERRNRCAFIQVTPNITLADVNADLKLLRDAGFDTVFVDEATLMDDFVEGAALFSDVFAAGGMHVVLSGTDSLGFLFAQDEQLYDRCILLHTTFIPYREFERVLGIRGVDEFIRYGGTMSMGGRDYNSSSTFATGRRASEYVDSAIAHNIQHSLRCYQAGGHFRALRELYDAEELTGAINRVVEDINHRFAVETLTRAFKSHDLAISARNLRSDRSDPTDVLDQVNVAEVTARLAEGLSILDAGERLVPIEPVHVREIKEYLDLLDVTREIPIVDMSDPARRRFRTAIAQPGLRYSQAETLVQSLLQDTIFMGISLGDRMRVLERIRSEVMGRMLEDLVILETMAARPGTEVFKLQFEIGEFDMVVFDPVAASCEIYEVKHSAERHPAQYRHLLDGDKRAATEYRYGPIRRTAVLYRGDDAEDGGVEYLNAEAYLLGLGVEE